MKYSNKNNSFIFKLTIFHDICARGDISHKMKFKAFPAILTGLALDHYYSNISISTTAMFKKVCDLI